MAFLVVLRGKNKGKRIRIEEYPFILGRDAKKCHYVVEDNEISRKHLRIKKRGSIYIAEDLDSRNGSYINGDKILNTTLTNGDNILLGTTELQFLAAHQEIHIAHEFANLEWESDFDLDVGVNEPIQVQDSIPQDFPKISRFDPSTYINKEGLTSTQQKAILDILGDTLVIENLTDCSNVFLKSLQKLSIPISKGAIFIWRKLDRALVPNAHWHYGGDDKTFNINKNLLRDSITRNEGISVPANSRSPSIIIVPISYQKETIGLLYLEGFGRKNFGSNVTKLLASLTYSVSPVFETLSLRKEMDSWLVGMVETMIATVEAKDTYTRGHSERVCRYAMAIADELKINRETKRMLMVSSLCHDIGKIGIPDSILKKASILSAEEYEEMKLHPTLGAELMKHMPSYKRFVSGVKYHHEKWDGTGYPEGLVGEEIPFFGRIVSISDVFDAMVSGRAYSGFMDESTAIERLEKEKELFDPQIFSAFVRAYNSGRLTIKTSTQNDMTTTANSEEEAPTATIQKKRIK